MLDSPAGTLSAEAAARQLETATIQKQKNLLERRFIAWCDDRGFRQGCLERCWQGRVIGTGAVSERPALSGCADQGPERGLEVRQVWRQRRSAVLEWLRGQCRHAIRAGTVPPAMAGSGRLAATTCPWNRTGASGRGRGDSAAEEPEPVIGVPGRVLSVGRRGWRSPVRTALR
jgi:hypothetical protein